MKKKANKFNKAFFEGRLTCIPVSCINFELSFTLLGSKVEHLFNHSMSACWIWDGYNNHPISSKHKLIIVSLKTTHKISRICLDFICKICNFEQMPTSYRIWRAWYNGSCTMMAKPISALELNYPLIHFLIIFDIQCFFKKSLCNLHYLHLVLYNQQVAVLTLNLMLQLLLAPKTKSIVFNACIKVKLWPLNSYMVTVIFLWKKKYLAFFKIKHIKVKFTFSTICVSASILNSSSFLCVISVFNPDDSSVSVFSFFYKKVENSVKHVKSNKTMFRSFGNIMTLISRNKNESSKWVKEFLGNGIVMSPKSQNIVLLLFTRLCFSKLLLIKNSIIRDLINYNSVYLWIAWS